MTDRRKERKIKRKPCGTEAAYRRHKRNNEYPCTDCLAAHVDYNREQDAKARTPTLAG